MLTLPTKFDMIDDILPLNHKGKTERCRQAARLCPAQIATGRCRSAGSAISSLKSRPERIAIRP